MTLDATIAYHVVTLSHRLYELVSRQINKNSSHGQVVILLACFIGRADIIRNTAMNGTQVILILGLLFNTKSIDDVLLPGLQYPPPLRHEYMCCFKYSFLSNI